MSAGDVVGASRPDLADPFRPVHGVGPMTGYEVDRVERAVRAAERTSGARFSVLIGSIGADQEPRQYAISVHAGLPQPDETVLIVVDPGAQALEIVTGSTIRRSLDDPECRLAAASMETSFSAGDLTGGLTAGIQQLATSAYHAPMLHAGEKY